MNNPNAAKEKLIASTNRAKQICGLLKQERLSTTAIAQISELEGLIEEIGWKSASWLDKIVDLGRQIGGFQKAAIANAQDREAPSPAEAALLATLEQMASNPDKSGETPDSIVSKAIDLWKLRMAKEATTAKFGGREIKDILLAMARHTGDVQDKMNKPGKGEPPPRVRVMVQEEGQCGKCQARVTLDGILDLGQFPDDEPGMEGMRLNWFGTKDRGNVA